MGLEHLKNIVIQADEPAAGALWKTVKSLGGTGLVVDEGGFFLGALTAADFPVFHPSGLEVRAEDLCNREAKRIETGPELQLRAKRIFEQFPRILLLPVLNPDRQLVDAVFKFQCFYEDYFREPERFHSFKPHVYDQPAFPYMYYALCLWRAAAEARRNGYGRISAIEFGVAGGNGLIVLEWHARAIARIFGIDIELYGFDSGRGLPETDDFRDLPQIFVPGGFQMGDADRLRERLSLARLVLGDIRETGPSFFERFSPAPVGAMLVDVDLYLSTLPVLNMLAEDHRHFLPRVQMYFDDIGFAQEALGEARAIREFNAQHEFLKICPEATAGTPLDLRNRDYQSFLYRIKECHRFQHPQYTANSNRDWSRTNSNRLYKTRW